MAKKNNKNAKKKVEEKRIVEQEDKGFDIHNKLFTVFCILMFFLAFYVLALYITNKHTEQSDDNTSSKETTVNYTEIMLGSSLTMKDGEYLVIYYDSKNEEISTDLNELVTNYRAGHGTTLYFVDMASAFNKSYVTEGESNHTPSSASELLINGPTVVKVNNKVVVEYIEGLDAVKEYLKQTDFCLFFISKI